MDFGLKKYLNQGENQTLDFKENITNSYKIAKTIVSFANSEGGIILVGIRDNKTISGIAPEEEKFMIGLALNKFCKPKPIVEYSIIEEDGKSVLKVEVKKGLNKPYKAKDEAGRWRAYVRVEDNSMLASVVWFKAELLKKKKDGFLVFGEAEKEVIHKLSTETCTFSTLLKSTDMHIPKLVNSLAILVSLNIIKIKYFNKIEHYAQVG